jgi:hypothetical protein
MTWIKKQFYDDVDKIVIELYSNMKSQPMNNVTGRIWDCTHMKSQPVNNVTLRIWDCIYMKSQPMNNVTGRIWVMT